MDKKCILVSGTILILILFIYSISCLFQIKKCIHLWRLALDVKYLCLFRAQTIIYRPGESRKWTRRDKQSKIIKAILKQWAPSPNKDPIALCLSLKSLVGYAKISCACAILEQIKFITLLCFHFYYIWLLIQCFQNARLGLSN